MPEAQEDADMEMIERHAHELGEHFDSVQILATRHEPEIEDGTVNCSYGVGNWFTRLGQVREWLIKSDERSRQIVRDEE